MSRRTGRVAPTSSEGYKKNAVRQALTMKDEDCQTANDESVSVVAAPKQVGSWQMTPCQTGLFSAKMAMRWSSTSYWLSFIKEVQTRSPS